MSHWCAQAISGGEALILLSYITWNGQVVRRSSLVTLLAVLQRVSASNGTLYPLVCQGITGGQWYDPSGVLFPLAMPDMVNVTLPRGGLGQ